MKLGNILLHSRLLHVGIYSLRYLDQFLSQRILAICVNTHVSRCLAYPLVRLGIFRLRNVTGANIVSMLAPGAFGSLIFVLTLYMQKVLGYSAIETGLAFLPMAAVILIVSNVVSRLVVRVGVKPFLVGGIFGLIVGLLLLTQIVANGNYLGTLLPGIVVVSLGMGPTFATMVIAATAGISDDEQGLASGVFNMTQQVGSGLVLAIVVAVSSARTATFLQHGQVVSKVAVTAGLQYALFVCVGFAVLAALAALFVIRERKYTATPSLPIEDATMDYASRARGRSS